MAKTKISEFSATPANNTDIDGINIAEGCAPSGINDAIRELMAQLKDWQSGTSNDPYVIGSSGSLTLNQGTANGVPYLNGSKVVTSGSALTFDGTNFATTGSVTSAGSSNSGNLAFTGTGNRITGDFSNATVANRVAFQSSTTNGNTIVPFIPNGTSTNAQVVMYNDSGATNSSTGQFALSSSELRIASGLIGTGSYLPMTFYTGGSERMRVDTSGNLGIGTSSPVSKLHIESTSAESLQIGYSSTKRGRIGATSAGDLQVYAYETGVGYRNILLATDAGSAAGNVGIGTSSPDTGVHLRVFGNAYYTAQYGTGNKARYGADATGAFIEAVGAIPLAFYTNSTERARITADARLLVGTTTGIANGTFCVKSNYSNAEACSFQGGSNGYIVTFHNTSGTLIGSITGSTGSTTAYNTSSDYRLKENIAPMTGALATVAQLKPCTYTWKVDGSSGQGFIAHELQEVVPDCVSGEKDAVNEDGSIKPQGIDTSFLVATLTAAIQEQQAIITALTARVAALESN